MGYSNDLNMLKYKLHSGKDCYIVLTTFLKTVMMLLNILC